MEKLIFGGLLGATLGFAVGMMGARAGGACPIMCNPYIACIFGGVIGAAVAGGLGTRPAAFTPSPHLVQVRSQEEFEREVLKAEGPVLVDFTTTGCSWCRKLEPVVHALADRYEGRVRVVIANVADVPKAAAAYGLEGFPTLILFRNGAPGEPIVGYRDEQALSRFLDGKLGSRPAE